MVGDARARRRTASRRRQSFAAGGRKKCARTALRIVARCYGVAFYSVGYTNESGIHVTAASQAMAVVIIHVGIMVLRR